MRFYYETSCVDCQDGDAINEMKAGGVQVSYRTMLRRCTGLLEWARERGYDAQRPGLTLQYDQCVGFFRSTFCGKRCYYVAWSGIEFIWTEATS